MIIDIDDGFIEVQCDNCDAKFSWFSSNPNLRLMWCEDCKVNRIEDLEAGLPGEITPVEETPTPIELPAVEPKEEKPYIDVGGKKRKYEKVCNYCDTKFATDILEREYCCHEHLENDIESEEAEQEGVIKPPRVSMKPADIARRSESQQLRRGLEKRRPVEKKDCLQCGTPTIKKLYCSDKCRKEYEAVLKMAAVTSNKPVCEECGGVCAKSTDFLCSDKCSKLYWSKQGAKL